MATLNKETVNILRTFAGGPAEPLKHDDTFYQLSRSVATCLLWEDTFYENGVSIVERIKQLVPLCDRKRVSDLAIVAREDMGLRHVPLLLVRELARYGGSYVEETLQTVITRADQLTEFVALYFNGEPESCKLSAAVKRGLSKAFEKFNAYQLAKYNRDTVWKLRDVMFMTHPKPRDVEQEEVWKQLVEDTLPTPDTWETALSAGADKKETFERLLRENKLGDLAFIRNLRNMYKAEVSRDLIVTRLEKGLPKVLPFQFLAATSKVPSYEGRSWMRVCLSPWRVWKSLKDTRR